MNLRGHGLRNGAPVEVSFKFDGSYLVGTEFLSPAELVAEAQAGTLLVTLTAAERGGVHADTPQPTLSVPAVGNFLSDGRPDLPLLPGDNPMQLEARHVRAFAQILVDGQVVSGSVSCLGGSFSPTCDSGRIQVSLDQVPPPGTHLLQVQNRNLLLSNELPILVQ